MDTASEGFPAMASGGSGDARGLKSNPRKPVGLEWEVYIDRTQKTRIDWDNDPQPWSAKTAMQYVGFSHFNWLWPRACHERRCRVVSTSYEQLENVQAKWRFLTILRSISDLER